MAYRPPSCQDTCQSIMDGITHTDEECISETEKGCFCMDGMVRDETQNNTCVDPLECPSIFLH